MEQRTFNPAAKLDTLRRNANRGPTPVDSPKYKWISAVLLAPSIGTRGLLLPKSLVINLVDATGLEPVTPCV